MMRVSMSPRAISAPWPITGTTGSSPGARCPADSTSASPQIPIAVRPRARSLPNFSSWFGTASAGPRTTACCAACRASIRRSRSAFPPDPAGGVTSARRRYTEGPALEPAYVWSHKHQITRIAAGRRLRVQLPRPASVHYTFDGWQSHIELDASDTTLGVWIADVPCNRLAAGAEFSWTAHYMTGWEGRNFSLTVE